MTTTRVAPWRSGMPGRPAVPLPPDPLPPWRGGRPLKRWTYVAVFAPDVMVCAAAARIGPMPLGWWAVWDRRQRTLAEHTLRRPRALAVGAGRVQVDDGPVAIELTVAPGTPVETVSPHGDEYIWTRKQGGVRITGTVALMDRRHEIDAPGVVDESAGYHARHTAWTWSAGVGVAASGDAVAWNLVSGVHDDPAASERTVWVGGEPHHVEPQPFRPGLAGVGDLEFHAEATRAHSENLLLVASSYEQPFGTFSGALPVAGPLREGYGVMERHDVRW